MNATAARESNASRRRERAQMPINPKAASDRTNGGAAAAEAAPDRSQVASSVVELPAATTSGASFNRAFRRRFGETPTQARGGG